LNCLFIFLTIHRNNFFILFSFSKLAKIAVSPMGGRLKICGFGSFCTFFMVWIFGICHHALHTIYAVIFVRRSQGRPPAQPAQEPPGSHSSRLGSLVTNSNSTKYIQYNPHNYVQMANSCPFFWKLFKIWNLFFLFFIVFVFGARIGHFGHWLCYILLFFIVFLLLIM